MKSPTVFFTYCAIFTFLHLFPFAANGMKNTKLTSDTIESEELVKKNLNKTLICQLLADQLITAETQYIKIEFEYHDIFVNEQALSYELMTKYQKMLMSNGIQPGSQRQIHLETSGSILVGDFGLYGELIREMPLAIPSEI
jgi:hypothetical protein